MIENKEIGLKIAESKEEELIENTIQSTETRIREMKLALELDEEVLRYLKTKSIK